MAAKIYQIITVLEGQRMKAGVDKGDFKGELFGLEKEAVNIVEE